MFQYVITGLAIGSIYAIASTSLVLTYQASGILNFGFGGMAFAVARTYYFLNTQHGWPIWAAATLSICVISPLFGCILYLAVFRFLRRAPSVIGIVTTIGLGVTLPPLCAILFGQADIVFAPGLAPLPVASFSVFGVVVTLDQVIIMACLVAIVVIGFLVLRYTKAGLVVRALVDSPALTSLMGTNPSVVTLGVWALTTFMTGLAGVLIAPVVGLTPTAYGLLVAAAFTAVLIAKLTRLGRVVVISLALGITSSVVEYVLPPASALTNGVLEGTPFAFILLFLLWEARRSSVVSGSVATGGALDRAVAGGGRRGASHRSVPLALRLHYSSPRIARRSVWNGRFGAGVLAVAIIAISPVVLAPFWTEQMVLGLCFAVTFLAFTLVTGEGGMIWLCEVSFAGVGASLSAFFAASDHMPILLAVLLAALVVASAGIVVGLLATRLGDLYVALATLAFGILIDNLILSLPAFSGEGGAGLTVTPPGFLGGQVAFFYFVLGIFGVCAVIIEHYRRSTAGLAMSAVRGSERAAWSLGINARRLKVALSGGAAFLAAIGGGLIAMSQHNASPGSFETIGGLVWLAVLVTVGVRSNVAALYAGVVFAVVPAVFQTYLPVSLAQVPVAAFGIGAILLARNPDGVLAMHARQAQGIARGVVSAGRSLGLGRSSAEAGAGCTSFGAGAKSRGRTTPGGGVVGVAENPAKTTSGLARPPSGLTPLGGQGSARLRASCVGVRFGGLQALSDVNIEIAPSTITGLVGPNGAGKTTLFEVMSGFLPPTAGRLSLGDTDITGYSAQKRSLMGISRTFQQTELFSSLTVAEHIVLGYRTHLEHRRILTDLINGDGWKGGSAAEMQRVEALLELLGLTDVGDEACAGLPTGIARLVEVGRALAGRPAFLLLDEPAAGLDTQDTRTLSEVLPRVTKAEGTGILLVDHDFDFVLGLSSSVYVLDVGRLIAHGSPDEIRTHIAVQEAYLGVQAT